MATIMIVDDEQNIRKTVRLVLEIEKFKVLEATSADDCWKKIQKNKPDLILLDIRMPGMPSVDLIKKIKENPKLKSIKIIYATALVGAKAETKKLKGVESTLEKPFKNEDLISLIKKVLSK
jgi:CheY-like chemotaxis protein